MSQIVWSSAVWADSLNEYCMHQFADVHDMVEHAFDYGATADGVSLDLTESDHKAMRLVSVELKPGRGAVPYPVMSVQWNGTEWEAGR